MKADKAYYEALDRILDKVYDEFDGSWVDLAIVAKVSISTVYNIGNRKTRYPYLLTVFKLAKAVGLELHVIAIARANRRVG